MNKKSLLAWLLYDVASSSYALLIGAVAFPIYFKLYVTENAGWSDALWGGLLAVSGLLAGLLAPVAGAVADQRGKRVEFLWLLTIACCASTALLAFAPADVGLVTIIFLAANTCYFMAASLYDSLMKQVDGGANVRWLSGLGWSLGYLGGLMAYLLCRPFLGSDASPASESQFALSFLIVAAFYGVLGTLAALGLRAAQEPARGRETDPAQVRRTGTLAEIARVWKTGGEALQFILSANLISGAANALGAFTPLILLGYFGLKPHEVAGLSTLFLLLSVPSTLFAGWISGRFSSAVVLRCLVVAWLMFMILLGLGEGWPSGVAVALVLGLILGPTNALVRGMTADVIRVDNAGLMFGFAALANRFAAALGPLLFGLVSSASTSRTVPLLVAGAVMLAGAMLVARMKSSWRDHTGGADEIRLRAPMETKSLQRP